VCSFSNLFSPSNKSTGRHQSLPNVRYSALQGTDSGSGSADHEMQSRSTAAERSPRVVRFRDEDMY